MPPQHEEVASHHSRSAEAPERREPVGVDAELLRQRAAEEETPILQRVALEVLIAVHRQASQDSIRCKLVFNSSSMHAIKLRFGHGRRSQLEPLYIYEGSDDRGQVPVAETLPAATRSVTGPARQSPET